jgi:transcriptional regulator with XRE-family HTH domain
VANVGDQIRSAREARGWSQAALASKLLAAGYPAGASTVERNVTKWEGGKALPRRPAQRLLAKILGCPLESLGFPPDVPESDEVSLLARIRADTVRLVELDSTYGGDDVVGIAARAWRSARDEIVAHQWTETAERDLHQALGDLASLAAWSAHDAERPDLARQMAMEAVQSSRLAGDHTMEMFARDALAMQAVHLGHAGEAAQLADEVLDGRRASPRTAAIGRIRRGGALALAGDHRRSFDDLGRARSSLADSIHPTDPGWAWWVDDRELDWHEGMALMRLGDPGAAIDRFASARKSWPPQRRRSRCGTLAHLIDAETAAGAWSDAERDVAVALDETKGIGSTRITRVLRRATGRVRDHAGRGPSSTLVDSSEQLLARVTA